MANPLIRRIWQDLGTVESTTNSWVKHILTSNTADQESRGRERKKETTISQKKNA
jgi:hypothetical protein